MATAHMVKGRHSGRGVASNSLILFTHVTCSRGVFLFPRPELRAALPADRHLADHKIIAVITFSGLRWKRWVRGADDRAGDGEVLAVQDVDVG